MANIRLALLITVALVVMIDQVAGFSFWSKSSRKLRVQLTKGVLRPSETKSILNSLLSKDRRAALGESSVEYILSRENDPSLDGKDCRRETILEHFGFVINSDFVLVLNVCKFINSKWTSNCRKQIFQVYDDNRLIARLGEQKLEPGQVGRLLNSIKDKENVKFGEVSAQTLLDQAPLLSLEDCQLDTLKIRNSYTSLRNLILVENLQSFDQARDRLFSYCAQNIRPVFEIATVNITVEAKEEIRNFLERPHESATIAANCLAVTKSVANVEYIKHQAKTSLSVGFDELLGNEWTELNNVCLYYIECYVEIHVLTYLRRSQLCNPESHESLRRLSQSRNHGKDFKLTTGLDDNYKLRGIHPVSMQYRLADEIK